jgi:GlpG protein
MFLLFAAGSNFSEALMGPSLLFGGLSGVMYGFFGYVLVQTLDPARNTPPEGYFLRSMTTMILLAWFALGVVQNDLPVTNWGNAGGLLLGLALGGLVVLMGNLLAKPAKD